MSKYSKFFAVLFVVHLGGGFVYWIYVSLQEYDSTTWSSVIPIMMSSCFWMLLIGLVEAFTDTE